MKRIFYISSCYCEKIKCFPHQIILTFCFRPFHNFSITVELLSERQPVWLPIKTQSLRMFPRVSMSVRMFIDWSVSIKKSSSLEPKGQWPWKLIFSIGNSRTTKYVQRMTLGWPWRWWMMFPWTSFWFTWPWPFCSIWLWLWRRSWLWPWTGWSFCFT